MSTTQKSFVLSEDFVRIKQELIDMTQNVAMKTDSTYSANIATYSDNLIPFVEKHLAYLCDHPKLNPDQYLANLRLMIKIR